MTLQRTFVTVTSVLLVTLVWISATKTRHVTPDIKKFLKAGDIVWVLATSANQGPECKVDIIDSIDGKNISFRRFIGYNFIMSEFQQFLEGRLVSSKQVKWNIFDIINVGFPGAVPTSAEKLVYLSPKNECGVFEVKYLRNTNAENTFELRSKTPTEKKSFIGQCFIEYNKTTRGKGRQISVGSTCQDILKGNDNIVSSIPMGFGVLR